MGADHARLRHHTFAVTKHTNAHLVLTAWLVATLAAGAGCKRRTHRVAPAASNSIAKARAPTLEARAIASSVVMNTAVFGDAGAPTGYERTTVWDLVPVRDGAAVLLLDSSKTTVLPIFVGGTEALTIRLDLDGVHYGRPLTHDLLASIVQELGGQPIKAQIDDLRDDTFIGSVFVRQGDRVMQLDARPSDAIAIALGSGAPLYVSRSVMLTSGVPREEVEKAQNAPEPVPRKTPISL